MTFASWCSSDKSSSPKFVESSVFSPRVAESESNLKIVAQEDISFYNNTPSVSSVKDDKHSSFGYLLIFMTNKMGVYSVQRESRPMWNNVDNIPPFIPQAAHGRSGNVTFPAGSVNVPAPIPAGRQNRPAHVHADRPFPAGRRNFVSVYAGWRNNAARPMSRLQALPFFRNSSRPSEVVSKSVAGSSFPAASSMLLPFDVSVQQDF
ncbi:hypothetical protein Tco_1107482 [Tanacetum coccineum]